MCVVFEVIGTRQANSKHSGIHTKVSAFHNSLLFHNSWQLQNVNRALAGESFANRYPGSHDWRFIQRFLCKKRLSVVLSAQENSAHLAKRHKNLIFYE